MDGHNLRFPIQKCEFFRKVKENKVLRGDVLSVRRTSNTAVWHRDCGKKAIYGWKL